MLKTKTYKPNDDPSRLSDVDTKFSHVTTKNDR